MKFHRIQWTIVPVLAVMGTAGHLFAGDLYDKNPAASDAVALPKPAEVQTLAVVPQSVKLKGVDDAWQLILTATVNGGRLQDLSGDVKYAVADPKVARVTSTRPRHPAGQRRHRDHRGLRRQDRQGRRHCRVLRRQPADQLRQPDRADLHQARLQLRRLPRQGVAARTASTCRCSASSRTSTINTLVKEGRGRRLFPAAPGQQPAAAQGGRQHGPRRRQAHGGRLRRVQAHPPLDRRRHALRRAERPDRHQDHRLPRTPRPDPQQPAAVRRLRPLLRRHASRTSPAGPSTRATTSEIAVVDGDGLVRTLAMSGEAAIMARYQGQVAVFRATVPLGVQDARLQVRRQDRRRSVHREEVEGTRHRAVGAVHRRAVHPPRVPRHHRHAADARSRSPTFVADKDANKRDKLVDRCSTRRSTPTTSRTSGPTSSASSGGNQPDRADGTFAFHDWIREAIAEDKPYDEFVRDILAPPATRRSPPTVWYKELQKPEQFVDDTAQVFLGLRLACAQCHHHPYEKWSQDDYWGLAAFFGRVGRKNVPVPGGVSNQQDQRQVIFNQPTGSVTNKRTGKAADDASRSTASRWTIGRDEDPRQKLVDWMADAEEPVLRQGRRQPLLGALLRPRHRRSARRHARHQPAVNPELLDALAKELGRQQVQPEAPDQDHLQEPDVSAQLDAQRVQQARQADLRPLLPAAHAGRGAVRRGLPGDRQPDRVQRPAAATSTRRTGRSCCRTSRSRRTSSTCSAGRSASAPASASASARPTWPRRCTCSTRDEVQDKLTARRRPGRAAGQGHAARRREGRGAVPVGLRPQADARSS